jgi:hypothetical protein
MFPSHPSSNTFVHECSSHWTIVWNILTFGSWRNQWLIIILTIITVIYPTRIVPNIAIIELFNDHMKTKSFLVARYCSAILRKPMHHFRVMRAINNHLKKKSAGSTCAVPWFQSLTNDVVLAVQEWRPHIKCMTISHVSWRFDPSAIQTWNHWHDNNQFFMSHRLNE